MQPQQSSRPTPIRWDDLVLLMACRRAGTLTAAAHTLALDPATVSRRLTQLETVLGVVLFQRGREGLVATSALEILAPLAEAAEVAMLRFVQAADGVETEVQGVVRLSMPPGVAETLLVPLLPKLLARHPQLRLEIDASTAYADLERREADLVLRVRRPEQGDLVACRLLEARLAVMAAPEDVDAAPPSALAALPWIAWDQRLGHLPEARWLASQVPDANVVVRSSALAVQLSAARQGVGAVLTVAVQGRHAGLVPVPLIAEDQAKVDALPAGALWLVCHRALRDVPRVAAVWSFLQEQVAELARAGAL